MTRDEVVEILKDYTNSKQYYVVTKGGKRHRLFLSEFSLGETEFNYSWRRIPYEDITYIGVVERREFVWPLFGSDPELFIVKDNKIVPSTKVIPESASNVISDGFQAELNPRSDSCRQVSGQNIGSALESARHYANRIGAEIALDVGVVVDDETFLSIPARERRFGCSPTQNVHEKN